MSAGISSTIASSAPTPMITTGVARVGCRRPIADGIWRLSASE